MHDDQGGLWTVVTAFLHEDGCDDTYLWHEYEAVKSMHYIA